MRIQKTIYYFSFLFLLVFLSYKETLYAEQQDDAVTLDEIVVTGEKADTTFQTGDVDTEQTPAFFSVIKREQFEGKMEDMAEVIEKEAGVQIRQSGGPGSFSTVSLRGSSSEQVIICLDGIPLNDASGGGVNLGNISLSDIDSIEIYRGITPVNFSRSSIGGVINIKTLRTDKGLQSHAIAGYGSFDTRRLSTFISHRPDKWNYLLSGEYLSSENDFDMLNDNGTEWNTTDDRWEKRNNAQFDQKNILGKLGYDFTNDLRADFQYQWYEKDQHLPNWRNSPKAKTSLDTTRHIAALKLTANDLTPYHLNTSTRISYSQSKEIYDDRNGEMGLSGSEYNEYLTTRYDCNLFLESLTQFHILGLTLDIQREEYDLKNLLGEADSDEKSRITFLTGLQDTIMLFQERLLITPGLRYTMIRDKAEEDDLSRDEAYFSPQIGIKYSPLDWLDLKTNLARYVREPSFFELFGDRGFFYGNEDLKAEEGINFDMGAEITYQPRNKGYLDRIGLNLNYFQSDTDDLITRVYSHGYGKAVNISSAKISGIEAGINLSLFRYFSLIGNATWQDTENQSERKDMNGKRLPGRFDTAYMGRLEGEYRGFKAYIEYITEKDMYYDAPNLLKAADKEEINVGISLSYKSFLLTVDAKNVGNDRYEDFRGYPQPGTSYFFTVKYEY